MTETITTHKLVYTLGIDSNEEFIIATPEQAYEVWIRTTMLWRGRHVAPLSGREYQLIAAHSSLKNKAKP